MNFTDEQKRKLLKLLKRLTGANHSEFGSKKGLKLAQLLHRCGEWINDLKLASLSDADFFGHIPYRRPEGRGSRYKRKGVISGHPAKIKARSERPPHGPDGLPWPTPAEWQNMHTPDLARLRHYNSPDLNDKGQIEEAHLYHDDPNELQDLGGLGFGSRVHIPSSQRWRYEIVKVYDEDPIVDGYRKANDRQLNFFEEAARRWKNVKINYPKDND